MYNATYLINGSFIFQKRRGPSEGARYLRIGLYLKNLGILGVLLALGVLTSGCRQASATLAPAVPPTVAVAPVAKSEAARELHLSGSLSAERSIALSFATIGIVERVTVREGEAVKKGQVLATVAQRGFQDALGIAEAKAKQAEDAYQRLMPIYKNKNLPEVKMVEVETGREQARLAVSMARKNLEDTVLRAPFAAVVATRNAEPGASASPVVPAFTLVQTGTLMATAPLPETLVSKVKRGTPARVTVQALNKTVEGEVREIAVVANPLTRTYDIKVALPNPEGALRIGMIADIYMKVDEGGGDLVVPPEAVRVDEKGAHYLFVVTPDKKLQRRQVQVAGFAGERLALGGNIRDGEKVVTSGTPMLADGMAVLPIERSTDKGAP